MREDLGAARPFAPGFARRHRQTAGRRLQPARRRHRPARRPAGAERGRSRPCRRGSARKLAGVSYCPEPALAAAAAKAAATEEAAARAAPPRAGSAAPTSSAARARRRSRSPARSSSQAPTRARRSPWRWSPPPRPGRSISARSWCGWRSDVDPETAQIHAVSDPVPHVYGGALLDIRSIVGPRSTGRASRSTRPTARRWRRRRTLHGGGDDPNNPGGLQLLRRSRAPSRCSGCEKLGFRPKLFMRLFGAHAAGAKNPKLRAVLQARGGDANIARAAVTLPHALILDQGNLARSAPGSSSPPTTARRSRSTASRAPSRRCSTSR